MDASALVKEALDVGADQFIFTVKKATELLCNQQNPTDDVTFEGKLVKLAPVGEAVVIGDLHGNLESLSSILDKSSILQRMQTHKDTKLIFLGDYGDRGTQSAEVYYAVLTLKLAFPRKVFLLRGNHEGPADLMASPHDLPIQFQFRFQEKGPEAYQKLRTLFSCLYLAVLVEGKYLMVHGGLPAEIQSLNDIAHADVLHPEKPYLEELLWSDPDEYVKRTALSPRGAGCLFGKSVTREVLAKLNVKILIRGHEPASKGYKVNHGGRVLTLFSRKGPPYFNRRGAYLDVPLAEEFEKAKQLLPYIHKF